MRLRTEYDQAHDIVYVHLVDPPAPRVARSIDLDRCRRLDEDAGGTTVGLEIEYPSRGVDLTGVPNSDSVAEALAALGLRVTRSTCG